MTASVQSYELASAQASPRLQRASWAFFDWAHQPYFTLVAAFLFKPYFAADYIGDPVRGQALVGLISGASAFLIAMISPFIGVAIDRGGRPKLWLLAASAPFTLCCFGLWLADPRHPEFLPLVAACMIGAAVSAELMVASNNAMLPHIAAPGRIGRLSGAAMALGSLGGFLGLAIYMGVFNLGDPPLAGLDKSTFEPQRAVGPFSAVWYLIFAIPLILWMPKRQQPPVHIPNPLLSQLKLLRTRPAILRFLIAKMLIGDGLVAAAVFGAVLAAGEFGWGTTELAVFAVLIMALTGVGAYLAGRADDRLGPKTTVMVALVALTAAIAATGSVTADRLFFLIPVDPPTPGDGLFAATSERVFLAMGLVLGAASGPLGASLRAWMARLSPPEEVGRWFGLYSFSGRATAFAAPWAIAALTAIFGDQRVTIPVVIAFLLAGLFVMRKVPQARVS